jgi:hypothetical protein
MEGLREATLDKWPTDVAPGERSAPDSQPNSAVGARVGFKDFYLLDRELSTAEYNEMRGTKVVTVDNGNTVTVQWHRSENGQRVAGEFKAGGPEQGPIEKSKLFLILDNPREDAEGVTNSQYERFFPPESTTAAFEAEYNKRKKDAERTARTTPTPSTPMGQKVAKAKAAGNPYWPSDVDTGMGMF